MENELNYVLKQLEQELSHCLNYAVRIQRSKVNNLEVIMMDIERLINSYRRGILDLYQNPSKAESFDRAALERTAEKFTSMIQDFSSRVEQYGLGPFSGGELQKISDHI